MISKGSSSPAGAVSAQTVTDLQTQIRALKNEQVGLKEQLSKLRQESSRHQARADEAEKQAAESARQAKSAKEEFEKQTVALRKVTEFNLMGYLGTLSDKYY
jgi:uncharacterized coiled-coil DUF342 family protein